MKSGLRFCAYQLMQKLLTKSMMPLVARKATSLIKHFVSVRGFTAGKLLDSLVVQAQPGLRWTVWNRDGIVGFMGVGAMAPENYPDHRHVPPVSPYSGWTDPQT